MTDIIFIRIMLVFGELDLQLVLFSMDAFFCHLSGLIGN